MAKGFLEVFPTLNIAEPLKELLALAEVEKVTSARDRSSIRVYMKSTRLIHKQNIYDLERGIKDQLFPDKQITIKIQEKYRLSGQYTPEKLLKMYKDSLLLELKHYSIVEYSMFRKAQIVFEDEGKMVLTVEDTMVNRDKTNELKRVLEKVFNERCGLPVEVAFQYIPPKENDRRKQIELKLEREAQAIYWQNHKDELENVSGGENISQTVAKSDNGEKKTHNSNADRRCAYCSSVGCFFHLCYFACFKHGSKRTDWCTEDLFRYLRIQSPCHSFLYSGRKPDE